MSNNWRDRLRNYSLQEQDVRRKTGEREPNLSGRSLAIFSKYRSWSYSHLFDNPGYISGQEANFIQPTLYSTIWPPRPTKQPSQLMIRSVTLRTTTSTQYCCPAGKDWYVVHVSSSSPLGNMADGCKSSVRWQRDGETERDAAR